MGFVGDNNAAVMGAVRRAAVLPSLSISRNGEPLNGGPSSEWSNNWADWDNAPDHNNWEDWSPEPPPGGK